MTNRKLDTRGTGSERGAALFVMVISVVVAAGLSMALLAVATGRTRSTEARYSMESALAIAEAGLARGLAEANLSANRQSVTWPPAGLTITSTNNPKDKVLDAADGTTRLGAFVIQFQRGDTDGVDNNGNGLVDAADPLEKDFVVVTSTGYYGAVSARNPYKVRVRGVFQKIITQFNVASAVFIDDPTPSVALGSGNSWYMSGLDHDMYNKNPVAGAPSLPAVASSGSFSPGDMVSIAAVSPPNKSPQVTGTSPTYQNNNPQSYDMPAMVDWARNNAPSSNRITATGTDPGGPFGRPPGTNSSTDPGDWQITFHDAGGPGNVVKFTGGAGNGAGIWIVDGDAEFGGNFNYSGIILVTGQVYYRGGGNRNFLGAVIAGKTTIDNLDVNGNASIKYSSAAVNAAKNAFARYSVVAWQKLSTAP